MCQSPVGLWRSLNFWVIPGWDYRYFLDLGCFMLHCFHQTTGYSLQMYVDWMSSQIIVCLGQSIHSSWYVLCLKQCLETFKNCDQKKKWKKAPLFYRLLENIFLLAEVTNIFKYIKHLFILMHYWDFFFFWWAQFVTGPLKMTDLFLIFGDLKMLVITRDCWFENSCDDGIRN